VVDEGQASDVAAFLLAELDAVERAKREVARLGRAHATREMLVDEGVEVEPELLIELVFDAAAAKERAESQREREEPARGGHASGLLEAHQVADGAG
jgi:hypothetical protein